MKKIFIIISVFLVFVFQYSYVFAISPTQSDPIPTPKVSLSPSSEPTNTADLMRIEKIKNLVASRVAELKLVDHIGFLGSVTASTNTQITIEDDTQTPFTIDIDELTQFKDSANSSFGISDIKKSNQIAVVGLYNKATKRLLARTVTKMHSLPVFFEGIITDRDTKNYTLTAIDGNGKSRIINIESSTKIQAFSNGNDGASKGGFSKIQIGQRVFAAGFDDLKDSKILNASRIIYFTDLPASTDMKSHAGNLPAPSTTITPTIGK